MESDRTTQDGASKLAANINAATRTIIDAYQGEASGYSPISSPGLSTASSSPKFWSALIENDRIEDRSEDQIEHSIEHCTGDSLDSATRPLVELVEPDQKGDPDAVNITESPNFYTATRPGTLLLPPLPMSARPSTISKMKDNLNVDISEWFDVEAASSSGAPHSGDPAIPIADSSIDHVLPSDINKDKFDPAVSFEEYLSLSQSHVTTSTWTSTSLLGKHWDRPARSSKPASQEHHVSKSNAANDVDLLKHAFKTGGQDLFLPAFSDSIYDEEFATFAAAGKSVDRQFQEIEREHEARKSSAKAMPSPSRLPGNQASELSPILQDDEFQLAGQIYVAHVLQQNPGLSDTHVVSDHSYTEEQVQWARSYLSNDVKVWMKRSCGVVGTEKPLTKWLNKALGKITPNPNLVLNNPIQPSSQKPVEQFSKATVDELNYWADHDNLMSLSELDTEWDAFEETRLSPPTVPGDLQIYTKPQDAALTLTALSPTSNISFATADEDEISMIPTLSTPKLPTGVSSKSLTDRLSGVVSPTLSAPTSGNLSVAPLVTKLSEILLDNEEENAAGSVLETVEANNIGEFAREESQSGLMTEVEAHSHEIDRLIDLYDYNLYGHRSRPYDDGFGIEEWSPTQIRQLQGGSLSNRAANPADSDIQVNQSSAKLSLRPEYLPDDNKEVSGCYDTPMVISDDEQAVLDGENAPKATLTIGKATGENELQQVQNQQSVGNDMNEEFDDQGVAVGLAKSNVSGYLLMDEGECETNNSRPFSHSELGHLEDSLSRSNTPINFITAGNNIAPNTINGPRPSSALEHARFPVSTRDPDQVKFPEDSEGAEKTRRIRRLPGQVIQLTSQQVEQFNLPLPTDTHLWVMEETNIGEKVYKVDNMVEIPALRQSRTPSPLKSANPALIRSTDRSQIIQGSHLSQTPKPMLQHGTAPLMGSADSPLPGSEQVDKSEGPQLPKLPDETSGDDDDERRGFKYPVRMRLFSEDLALSSPHKSDPLEPFEDLPQKSKHLSAKHSEGFSPRVPRSTPNSASAPKDMEGNSSSLVFSFTNKMHCSISARRMEDAILMSRNPTLRSLKMWPSLAIASSASQSTFEFKVTGPGNVDLVTTLHELFPGMVTKMRGDVMLYVPGTVNAPNSGSPADVTPSATGPLAVVAVKTNRSKGMQKYAKEQQKQSSRASIAKPEPASHATVDANTANASQDPKDVKRRRSSSRCAGIQADQEKPVAADKKRRKTND